MLVEERRQKILDLVSRQGFIGLEDLARSIQLDPGDPPARHQYYRALIRNGKKAEADRQQEETRRIEADIRRINDLLKVQLQKTPDDPVVYHEVALIVLRAGRPREVDLGVRR